MRTTLNTCEFLGRDGQVHRIERTEAPLAYAVTLAFRALWPVLGAMLVAIAYLTL